MASDTYSSSGGWSGGSALTAGGVLSNYYQKLQTVNPQSGSLTAAQPTQASTQPSSLSRVAATTPATQATPTATPTQAAAPTIAVIPTVAATPAVSTVAAPVTTSGVQASIDPDSHTGYLNNQLGGATTTPASTGPVYSGPVTITGTGSYGPAQYVVQRWNNLTGSYELDSQATAAAIDKVFAGTNVTGASFMADPSFAAVVAQSVAAANSKYSGQISAYQAAQTAAKQQTDQSNAVAQQLAADQATRFNLAAGLQAPNTTAVDTAGQNDLARVLSQYRSGLGGVDASAYAAAGQGAVGTQAAVNAVNHQTAYANAFNDNYKTFANALTSQQTADANAAGQKLNLDVQGISDAISTLSQQASQLSTGAQTQLQSQLIPLKNQLAQYQNAVLRYGVASDAASKIAQAILGGASSLAALAVGG